MKTHSFNIEDAKKYGVDCATILYNLRYWLEKNKANEKHVHDGRVWTYNSTKAFAELFPYLSEKQIYRRLKKLEDEGVIITGNYNKHNYDQTKWYTVDEPEYCISRNEKDQFPKSENGNSETEEPIPDINTDINTDNILPTKNDLIEYFTERGDMIKSDIPLEAENFINHYEDREWKNTDGKKIKSWKRQASTWNNNYQKFNDKRLEQHQTTNKVMGGGTW